MIKNTKSQRRKPLQDRVFLEMNMKADSKHRYYERWTDTLLSFIGDLGGMSQIILGLGMLLSQPIVNHLLNSKLINSVYQVQQYVKDNSSL